MYGSTKNGTGSFAGCVVSKKTISPTQNKDARIAVFFILISYEKAPIIERSVPFQTGMFYKTPKAVNPLKNNCYIALTASWLD